MDINFGKTVNKLLDDIKTDMPELTDYELILFVTGIRCGLKSIERMSRETARGDLIISEIDSGLIIARAKGDL